MEQKTMEQKTSQPTSGNTSEPKTVVKSDRVFGPANSYRDRDSTFCEKFQFTPKARPKTAVAIAKEIEQVKQDFLQAVKLDGLTVHEYKVKIISQVKTTAQFLIKFSMFYSKEKDWVG